MKDIAELGLAISLGGATETTAALRDIECAAKDAEAAIVRLTAALARLGVPDEKLTLRTIGGAPKLVG